MVAFSLSSVAVAPNQKGVSPSPVSEPSSNLPVVESPVIVSPEVDDKAAARDLRARELYALGDRLYAEGNYEAAVASFEAAYELSERPQLLFNIANALERLGRYQEARRRLEDYAPHAPPPQRDAVTRRILSLKVRARQQRQEILTRMERELAKAKQAPPPAALPLEAPEATDPIPVLGYSLLGLGAAGIATGAVFAFFANSDHADAENLCAGNDGRMLCPATARGALDSERVNATVADLSLGLGILAVAGGAYLIFRDDGGDEVIRARALPSRTGWRLDFVTTF